MSGDKRTHGLRLLSLDGGGVRGLSSLQIVKQLMETINPDDPPRPCEVFDMIGGTSTGGLIAVMLGRLRMDVEDCMNAYADLSDKIFQKQKHRFTLNGNIQGRFDSAELERVIKNVVREQGLEVNELLKDDSKAPCKVFVCAVRKENAQPMHFRSYRYPRGGGSLFAETKIWEACRATSAATSFFDPITIGRHKNEFVDGAVGSNNPVRSVFTEAATFWDVEGRLPDHLNCLVSVGTGMPATKPYGDKFWDIANTLVKIATESEATATSFAEENSSLEDSGCYYRFNVSQGLQEVQLEDAAAQPTIVAATETYLEGRQVYQKIRSCAKRLEDYASRASFTNAKTAGSSGGKNVSDTRSPSPTQTQTEQRSSVPMMKEERPRDEPLIARTLATAPESSCPEAIGAVAEKRNTLMDELVGDLALSPEESLRSAAYLRNRRRQSLSSPRDPFWLTKTFQRWKDDRGPSLVAIRSTFSDRFVVKDFCLDAIEIVRKTAVGGVIWALAVPPEEEPRTISVVDVQKSLVAQASCLARSREWAASGDCTTTATGAEVQSGRTEYAWTDLLASALCKLEHCVVVIDLELCSHIGGSSTEQVSLPGAMLSLLEALSRNTDAVRVKIVLIGYASWSVEALVSEGLEDFVVEVGKYRKWNLAS